MHILKRVIVTIFIISLIVFLLYFDWNKLTTDETLPTISCTTDTIEMSINDDEAILYDGVSAWDDKDGDITENVFIEEISQFIREGVCNVTYAVVDSDNHVAKLTRRLSYTDYTSPEFILEKALVFTQGQTFSILDYVDAVDVIDGYIHDKIKTVDSTVDTTEEGSYEITIQVTNSLGDTVEETLPVYVVSSEDLAVTIELSTYLVYVDSGENFDPSDYVESVTGSYGEEMDKDSVTLKSKVDLSTPGVYTVKYSAEDDNGNKGITRLVVIVRE